MKVYLVWVKDSDEHPRVKELHQLVDIFSDQESAESAARDYNDKHRWSTQYVRPWTVQAPLSDKGGNDT